MMDPLRVLVVTRLFPNAAEPLAAAFNRQQMAHLARQCRVHLQAVIPWFPGAGAFSRWSAAGRLMKVPAHEQIAGIDVAHPRVMYLPRFGHALAPPLYAASVLPHIWALRDKIDVVLGSWAFPDGAAAVLLGQALGVPTAIKLHGSDMNVIAEQPAARRWLRWALPRADRVIAVSRGLADRARAFGVADERLELVPNGVDRKVFHPRDRGVARLALREQEHAPLDDASKVILYVGRLERAKGIRELLAAFSALAARRPEVVLALVGQGSEADLCRQAARDFAGRLIVVGSRPLDEVATWVGACDVLALPSWNEGTPNVVLEALASGRRVVATSVGGIPDVVTSPTLGELVAPRQVPPLIEALERALHSPYDPAQVAAAAPGSWEDSALALLGALRTAAAQPIRTTPATWFPGRLPWIARRSSARTTPAPATGITTSAHARVGR